VPAMASRAAGVTFFRTLLFGWSSGGCGQGDRVSIGIGDPCNSLAPEHVLWRLEHLNVTVSEPGEGLIDVVDVDEHFEARAGTTRTPISCSGEWMVVTATL
jgi:hypothetical protein